MLFSLGDGKVMYELVTGSSIYCLRCYPVSLSLKSACLNINEKLILAKVK